MEKEALLNGLKGIRRQEIIPDAAYVKILSAAIKYIEDGWQSPSDNRGYSESGTAGGKGEQEAEGLIMENLSLKDRISELEFQLAIKKKYPVSAGGLRDE